VKLWLQYVLAVLIGLLVAAVYRIVTGSFNPGATWSAIGIWFLIFLLWWLLLQRRARSIRFPKP
jgi:hypothetical protein